MKYELNLESKQSRGSRGVAVQDPRDRVAAGWRTESGSCEGRPWWKGGTAADTR